LRRRIDRYFGTGANMALARLLQAVAITSEIFSPTMSVPQTFIRLVDERPAKAVPKVPNGVPHAIHDADDSPRL
jgi:hypothetical protein